MGKIILTLAVLVCGYFAYTLYAYEFVLNNIREETPAQMRMGNLDADITITAYLDYNSAESRKLNTLLFNFIARRDDVQVIIRPVSSDDPVSELAQKLALSAKNYDRFLEVHSALMSASSNFDENHMVRAIQSVGLGYETVKGQALSADIETESMKLNGEVLLVSVDMIPTFFIRNYKMEGAEYTNKDIRDVIRDIQAGRL